MICPPPIKPVDMELIKLRARDDVAIAEYNALDKKMEAAVLAAIAGGKTVQEAKEVAAQLYEEEKALAWERVVKTGEDLYVYRSAKAEAAAKGNSKPWWRIWAS